MAPARRAFARRAGAFLREVAIVAEWMRAAGMADLPSGRAMAVELAGKTLALFNVEGAVFAVDDACTHADGPLSEGVVDGCVVECPWHAGRFDLRNGEALTPPATEAVRTYPVRVEGSEIQVRLG